MRKVLIIVVMFLIKMYVSRNKGGEQMSATST
jgi:hypothetical protein